MRTLFTVLISALLGAAAVVWAYLHFTTSTAGDEFTRVILSEAEVQAKIGRKFPQEDRILEIFPIVIQEPQVKFLGDSKRLQLTALATIKVPFIGSEEISLTCTSDVHYQDKDKTLRVSKITVETIETSSLPARYREGVRLALTALARKELEDEIVYTLEPEDYGKRVAEIVVRDIEIRDRELHIIIGL